MLKMLWWTLTVKFQVMEIDIGALSASSVLYLFDDNLGLMPC
mgnify:CR=1 FL=1